MYIASWPSLLMCCGTLFTVGKVVCDGDPGVMVREKSCHHESGGSLETGKEEEEEKRVCDVLWRDKEDRTGITLPDDS